MKDTLGCVALWNPLPGFPGPLHTTIGNLLFSSHLPSSLDCLESGQWGCAGVRKGPNVHSKCEQKPHYKALSGNEGIKPSLWCLSGGEGFQMKNKKTSLIRVLALLLTSPALLFLSFCLAFLGLVNAPLQAGLGSWKLFLKRKSDLVTLLLKTSIASYWLLQVFISLWGSGPLSTLKIMEELEEIFHVLFVTSNNTYHVRN